MQSMGHFLAVRPHRVCSLGGGYSPDIQSKRGTPRKEKKKGGTRGIFAGYSTVRFSPSVALVENARCRPRLLHFGVISGWISGFSHGLIVRRILLCSSNNSVSTE